MNSHDRWIIYVLVAYFVIVLVVMGVLLLTTD